MTQVGETVALYNLVGETITGIILNTELYWEQEIYLMVSLLVSIMRNSLACSLVSYSKLNNLCTNETTHFLEAWYCEQVIGVSVNVPVHS